MTGRAKKAVPAKWAHVVCVRGVHYAVCREGVSEAFVKTASGRTIQFPKLGKREKASALTLHTFLRSQAMTEAAHANDDHCLVLFAQVDPASVPPSILDDLNDYLFDPKLKRSANGFLTITAPLGGLKP